MEALWFCLVGLMLTVYVILDGFDLGAGIVQFIVGRTEAERGLVQRTVGPVWDGNEVWLLAAGGTLFCAFPAVYAASFSGLYLPLMMVLWLLILRGISIEFRNHGRTRAGKLLGDSVFAVASALLAILLGAALGNVLRGVPLNASGSFFLPLWTNFQPWGEVGVLDWYTVVVGLLAFFALAQHGALWVALKTEAPLEERAQSIAAVLWPCVAGLTLVVAGLTLRLQPLLSGNLASHRWSWVVPAFALLGLGAVRGFLAQRDNLRAFLSSSVYLAAMLASAGFAIHPYLLPSNLTPRTGLSFWNAATAHHGLRVALAWWIPGMLLVLGYFTFVYRHFRGKVRADGY